MIELADSLCRQIGITKPRIAVAGLNPHCSENGMFGTEEMDEIIPAVEFAREKGINCIGPVAPDTYFQKQQAVFMILLLQCIMIRVISR